MITCTIDEEGDQIFLSNGADVFSEAGESISAVQAMSCPFRFRCVWHSRHCGRLHWIQVWRLLGRARGAVSGRSN